MWSHLVASEINFLNQKDWADHMKLALEAVRQLQVENAAKAKNDQAKKDKEERQTRITFQAPISLSAGEKVALERLCSVAVACEYRPLQFAKKGSWVSQLLTKASRGRWSGMNADGVKNTLKTINAEVGIKLASVLAAVDTYSLTTDAWSQSCKSFVAFTAHYIDTSSDQWKLEDACLSVQQLNTGHTAAALGNTIISAVNVLETDLKTSHEMALLQSSSSAASSSASSSALAPSAPASDELDSKCVYNSLSFIVADGASAQRAAFKQENVVTAFPYMNDLWCIAHKSHLAVRCTIMDDPAPRVDNLKTYGVAMVTTVITKLRRLSAKIKNSYKLTAQVGEHLKAHGQEMKQPILDVITRWTSTRDSIVRAVLLKDGIKHLDLSTDAEKKQHKIDCALVGIVDEKEVEILWTALADNIDNKALTDSEWRVAELIRPVLDIVISSSTHLTGQSYATLGSVWPNMIGTMMKLTKKNEQHAASLATVTEAMTALAQRMGVMKKQAEMQSRINGLEEDKVKLAAEEVALSNVHAFTTALYNNLKRRFDPLNLGIENKWYLIATLLHPRYKKLTFLKKAGHTEAVVRGVRSTIYEWLEHELEKMDGRPSAALFVKNGKKQLATLTNKVAVAALAAAAAAAAAADVVVGEDDSDDDFYDDDEDTADDKVLLDHSQVYDAWLAFPTKSSSTSTSESTESTTSKASKVDQSNEFKRFLAVHPSHLSLVRLALQMYATPASSAPTERVWSVATNTLVKNRRRLNNEVVCDIVRINSNVKLVSTFILKSTPAHSSTKRKEPG